MELSELLYDTQRDTHGDPGDEDRLGEAPDLLKSSRRSRKIETDMDITTMIDITFLLLIFFLVASRIDDNAAVQLPTAKHGTAVTVDDSAILTVIPQGSNVAVYMGESVDDSMRIQDSDIDTQNEMITDYVQRELMGDVPKQQVLVRAAKGIKYHEVARIISAAAMAEGADVYVAVIEE